MAETTQPLRDPPPRHNRIRITIPAFGQHLADQPTGSTSKVPGSAEMRSRVGSPLARFVQARVKCRPIRGSEFLQKSRLELLRMGSRRRGLGESNSISL